jgi:hypothetical protein
LVPKHIFAFGCFGKSKHASIVFMGFLRHPNGLELLEGNCHDRDDPHIGESTMTKTCLTLGIPSLVLDPIPPWFTLLDLKVSIDCYIQKA